MRIRYVLAGVILSVFVAQLPLLAQSSRRPGAYSFTGSSFGTRGRTPGSPFGGASFTGTPFRSAGFSTRGGFDLLNSGYNKYERSLNLNSKRLALSKAGKNGKANKEGVVDPLVKRNELLRKVDFGSQALFANRALAGSVHSRRKNINDNLVASDFNFNHRSVFTDHGAKKTDQESKPATERLTERLFDQAGFDTAPKGSKSDPWKKNNKDKRGAFDIRPFSTTVFGDRTGDLDLDSGLLDDGSFRYQGPRMRE